MNVADHNAVLEAAAQVADAEVDHEWPNDEQSLQAKRIAEKIRAMKVEPQ